MGKMASAKTRAENMWGKNHSKGKTAGGTGKCWESHPEYIIKDDDGAHAITGGSCTSTYAEDYDIYIGLDYGAKKGKRAYPWNEGVDIYFKIQDMGVPQDLEEFKKLLSYTAKAMRAGKSVFVGCIGGHGRTGLFLAALTEFMTGEKDAINIVREKYCEKAVESTKQVNWLHEHFGIKKAEPTKGSYSSKSITDYQWGKDAPKKQQDFIVDGKITDSEPTTFYPVAGESIFDNH